MYNLNWHRSFDLCKLVDARQRARCECFLSLTLVWLDASTRVDALGLNGPLGWLQTDAIAILLVSLYDGSNQTIVFQVSFNKNKWLRLKVSWKNSKWVEILQRLQLMSLAGLPQTTKAQVFSIAKLPDSPSVFKYSYVKGNGPVVSLIISFRGCYC